MSDNVEGDSRRGNVNERCVDSPSLCAHPIPITIPESYFLSAKGVFVRKAVLTCDGLLLGVITPKYDVAEDEQSHTAPPHVDLRFFGDTPIHGALMQGRTVSCTIYTVDQKIPSIVFAVVDNGKTWGDTPSPYTEVVEAQSDAGPVKRTLYYSKTQVGFIAA